MVSSTPKKYCVSKIVEPFAFHYLATSCPKLLHCAGLDYLSEYIDDAEEFEPGYICTLCQSRLNPRQAIRHAIGDAHALKYMEKHHERRYAALHISTLPAEVRATMKQRHIAEIAASEKR